MHSPVYGLENRGALQQDWPRTPLPRSLEQLQAGAELGKQVAALLNVEASFAPSQEVQGIGRIAKRGRCAPTLEDRKVTVAWGRKGRGETIMPGRGKTEPDTAEFPAALGEKAISVCLNDDLYWENVPLSVWEYTMGGYQVVKKWLSYRESAVLGRALSVEEIRYVSTVFQRIASLLLLSKQLDASYRSVSAPAVIEEVEAAQNASA